MKRAREKLQARKIREKREKILMEVLKTISG